MQSVSSTSVPLSQKYTLVGRSRAGDGTTFCIPELRWMFDCGALVEKGGLKQPHVIWITHTHSDHVFTLAHFTHRRELVDFAKKNGPLPVYLPASALPLVETYLKAYAAMVTMGEEEEAGSETKTYELIGVTPGQEISISNKFVVRVVECVHRVDCVGYSIFEKQKKMMPEYVGLEGKEIGKLRKQGVEIFYPELVLSPVVCYLGDTTAGVFEKHPEILEQHSVVVVECSFIDTKSLESAKRTKHMHWHDLRVHVEAHPETLFVLTHFSLKYSCLKLLDFFNRQSTNNLHPMLVQQEIMDGFNGRKEKKALEKSMPCCQCFVCQPEGELQDVECSTMAKAP